jgi:hypothetical protein
MQTHTPGPWVIGQESTDLMASPEGGRFHAIDAPAGNHYALAVVVTQLAEPTEKSTEELQANARLLAAAPELLAALVALSTNPHGDLGDMIYHVKERECEGWDGASVTAWSNAVAAARAVIAKATGVTL